MLLQVSPSELRADHGKVLPSRSGLLHFEIEIHYRNVLTAYATGDLAQKLTDAVQLAKYMKIMNCYELLWHEYGEWWKFHPQATFCDFFAQYDLCEFNSMLSAVDSQR